MAGVKLTNPATQNPFSNTGTITGNYGVYGTGVVAWTVSNTGTITGSASAGVSLALGGMVVNGAGKFSAKIDGYTAGIAITGGSGTVFNAGIVTTLPGASQNASGVTISGGIGVVTNTGSINGSGAGVRLQNGGRVANGGSSHLGGTISGGFAGVAIYGAPGTVANNGFVTGGQVGVVLGSGGQLVNGSSAVPGATIKGVLGAWAVAGTAAVTNFGTIVGLSADGCDLFKGGSVVNGAATDRKALISSYNIGIAGLNSAVSVTNFGTVTSQHGAGVDLSASGTIINGSAQDATALISGMGYAGVVAKAGTLSVTNYGTVQGYSGFKMTGTVSATIDNLGTIQGGKGPAIRFAAGANRLIEHPGAAILGTVRGGTKGTATTNTLELASGASAGTISGIGPTINGFGTIALDAGAEWSLSARNSLVGGSTIALGAGATLATDGTLAVGGGLSLAGSGTLAVGAGGMIQIGRGMAGAAGRITIDKGATLTASGAVAGGIVDRGVILAEGRLRLDGTVSGTGTIAVDKGAETTIIGPEASTLRFLAGGKEVLDLNAPAQFSGVIKNFASGPGNRIDLLKFAATNSAFSAGTLTLGGAAGSVALHFAGNYTLASFRIGSDNHGGTVIAHG